MTRLGIFGGTFDPVHAGQLHAARSAQRAFRLDRVVFVPALNPPHKAGRGLAPRDDRLAMLRHGVNDLRLVDETDLRFLRQFA